MINAAVVGLCLSYSLGGSNPCTMLAIDSAVYIHDAYNVHIYTHVIGDVYSSTINGRDNGHHLCKLTETSFNCFLGINFNEN